VKFLVDANVLSEATRSEPDERCVAWLHDARIDAGTDAAIIGDTDEG